MNYLIGSRACNGRTRGLFLRARYNRDIARAHLGRMVIVVIAIQEVVGSRVKLNGIVMYPVQTRSTLVHRTIGTRSAGGSSLNLLLGARLVSPYNAPNV